MPRTFRPVLLILLVGILLTSCSSASSSSQSTRSSAPTATATPSDQPGSPVVAPGTPAPPPAPPALAAPIVIQIENSPAARPQSGISQADIVYEYETEGGITRFSSLWFHDPTAQVGPVRSARIATVKLLQIFNGTLVYSGAGNYVEGLFAADGIRKYDEASGVMFRVGSRAAPHNLYTDGAAIGALRTRAGGGTVGYQLYPRTALAALPTGINSPVPAFTVPISNEERPHFVYDPPSGAYTRTEPTGQMVDAATGTPWFISTVVLLQVPVAVAPQVHDVNGALGLDHGIVGSGPAQIMVGGNLYSGTYTQGPAGPPVLTLTNGAPAPIAPGQVLVVLMRTGTGAQIG